MEVKFYVILAVFIIFALLGFFTLRQKSEKKLPTLSYALVMEIFNETIQREIKHKYDDYRVRDVKFPADYTAEVISLSNKIVTGISPYILEELQIYHPRSYLFNQVNKDVQLFFIEYMKSNKPNFSGQ
jgi:hypothetical protein